MAPGLQLREPESRSPCVAGGAAHPCYRECDGTAMRCEYNLTLSLFSTLSVHCGDCPANRAHCARPGCIAAGGTNRPVYVANLMLPGPAINVSAPCTTLPSR